MRNSTVIYLIDYLLLIIYLHILTLKLSFNKLVIVNVIEKNMMKRGRHRKVLIALAQDRKVRVTALIALVLGKDPVVQFLDQEVVDLLVDLDRPAKIDTIVAM